MRRSFHNRRAYMFDININLGISNWDFGAILFHYTDHVFHLIGVLDFTDGPIKHHTYSVL